MMDDVREDSESEQPVTVDRDHARGCDDDGPSNQLEALVDTAVAHPFRLMALIFAVALLVMPAYYKRDRLEVIFLIFISSPVSSILFFLGAPAIEWSGLRVLIRLFAGLLLLGFLVILSMCFH